jgi:hypothetical protein
MKFIRSTYGLFFFFLVFQNITLLFLLDQEMDKIQATIKQLQKNFSELQYDLHLKERQTPNIYDSIECEIIWKRHRMDDIQTTIVDGSEDDEDTHTGGLNHDDEDIHDYSTTGTPPPSSTPSPTSYEHCLLSFLVGNDSLTSTNNRDDKITSSDIKKILPIKKQLLIEKKQTNNTSTTILNNNNKKRRVCMSCGKC